jgi:uncharacterized protein (TIGR03083 family)
MTTIEPLAYLPLLREEVAKVSVAFRAGDLTAVVPSCPGWDVADLARHLGSVQRWSATALRTAAPADFPDGPADLEEIPDWYDESARQLLDALSATSPDAPSWHFGPKPRYAEFWFRRQALEAAVHRWDAETALGAASPIDAALAADGVAEVVDIYFARLLRNGKGPVITGTVLLAPSDIDGSDVRLSMPATSSGSPDAVVRGTAQNLLLLAWGRAHLGAAAFTVEGHRPVAEGFFTTGLLP